MIKILLALILFALIMTGGYYYLQTQNSPRKAIGEASNQDEKKVAKIGLLSLKGNKTYDTAIASMKDEIKKKGAGTEFIENYVKSSSEFEAAAQNLVAQQVDTIVTYSTPATKAAIKATSTIPIVFGSVGDPVLNGIAKSLDSSGNNATGVSSISVDLTPKRLEVLKQAAPNIKRVFFVEQPGEVSSDNSKTKTVKEADKLGIKLVIKEASNAADVKKIADSLSAKEADAIMMSSSAMVWGSVADLIAAQDREKIPLAGIDVTMADRGASFSYGPDYAVMGQQVAETVIQVLSGVKPQYIAIQRPKKVELIVSEKVFKSLGIAPPDSFISKADRVIK